jgi:transcriptional regulator with XRE-family HTH domain
MTEFSAWLNRRFLEWQLKTGRPQTAKAFAEYLGVKQSTYSGWANGTIPPSPEGLARIADKLGREVYLAAGSLPPELQDKIQKSSPEAYKELLDIIESYLTGSGKYRK